MHRNALRRLPTHSRLHKWRNGRIKPVARMRIPRRERAEIGRVPTRVTRPLVHNCVTPLPSPPRPAPRLFPPLAVVSWPAGRRFTNCRVMTSLRTDDCGCFFEIERLRVRTPFPALIFLPAGYCARFESRKGNADDD